MSSFVHLKHRNGRFTKNVDAASKGSNSQNTRHIQNDIPRGSSKHREPKRLKTKRGYAHVQSKYSSVFSKYLKEPAYPASVKVSKINNGKLKNQQDRLILKLFGNENNYKMIKSLMNENADSKTKYESLNKSNIEGGSVNRPPLNRKFSNKEHSSPKSIDVTNSEKHIVKDKDFEVKLEKALLDLSEHKNNFYKDKSEFDKQIEQTKQDKDTRIRQTFYGSNAFPAKHNLLSGSGVADPSALNASNYYKPGYQTGLKARPTTQDGNANKTQYPGGEALSDGNILSNIDCISSDELKERLIVAEMIMKKLYTRNKDLETAIDKAQNKIKEVKRNNTTQNFFKSNYQEDKSNIIKTEGDIEENNYTNNHSIQKHSEDDNDQNSEIEIGCKECEKYREKENKLNQELDLKIKYIFELEQKFMNEKYNFDSTTYNQYLHKRLNDTLDESKRHFDNYVQIRNLYHDLLEDRATKKRGKRIANDSDLLNLK